MTKSRRTIEPGDPEMVSDNGSKKVVPDPDYLLSLVEAKMPFGKYAGTPLIRLPEPYLVWLFHNGFPEGKLGEMLRSVYEIKLNGLEYLLKPLMK